MGIALVVFRRKSFLGGMIKDSIVKPDPFFLAGIAQIISIEKLNILRHSFLLEENQRVQFKTSKF